jgi:hypothetical protein
MILLEPAHKILHTYGEVQAADHLSNPVLVALRRQTNSVVRKDCFRSSRLVRLPLESVTGFAFEVQHKLEFWASHDEDSARA